MTIILLISHGENDALGKFLVGRTPGIHLNDIGIQQAEDIANVLAPLPVKAVYSSPMERTIETAEPLAKAKNLPVYLSESLNEFDYGEWQGKTFEQLRQQKLWESVITNPAQTRFPGGESFPCVHDRISKEIDRLAGVFDSDDVVACFSHGDIIRLAVAYYLNIPINHFQRLVISTASITALHFGGKYPHMICVNQLGCQSWAEKLLAFTEQMKKHSS